MGERVVDVSLVGDGQMRIDVRRFPAPDHGLWGGIGASLLGPGSLSGYGEDPQRTRHLDPRPQCFVRPPRTCRTISASPPRRRSELEARLGREDPARS